MNPFVLCLVILTVLGGVGACATTTVPLATLPGSSAAAAQHNLEGIRQYQMAHWDAARGHFETAIHADPNLAEAHYNLALALHQLEAHDEATRHFKMAGKLAPKDSEIVKSAIYRNHMGLSSTFEQHISGGYRY